MYTEYHGDGYGDYEDGRAFDGTGVGRPWPLLTGERAHYELAAGNRAAAQKLLAALEGFASDGHLLPEQIWDAADIPEHRLFRGRPSGSAMPLAWAHAEHIKLLRSLAEGRVFDMPPQPRQRYQVEGVRSRHCVWRFNNKCRGITAGSILRVELLAPAVVHWSSDGWRTIQDSGLGIHFADLDTAILATGGEVILTYCWRAEQPLGRRRLSGGDPLRCDANDRHGNCNLQTGERRAFAFRNPMNPHFQTQRNAMKKQVVAVAVAAALAFAVSAGAQQSGKGQMMEAVVTVTKINRATRTVYVQTSKGETAVSVPADIKLDQLQVGARYRVRYQEAVAVAIEPGAQPSAAAGATAEVAPQSSPASGQALKTDKVAGVIDAIDPAGKEITLRTLDGGKRIFKVAESVDAGALKPGEAVTVTYEQAVATHMVSTPQPISDPAPAR